MIPTWISPWNSKQITSDELIHEVSLDALSELYNIAVLRLPEPEIVIEQDSIIIHSASIDYKYVISFPRVLYDEMTSRFPAALKILQAKYRLLSAAESSNQLDGEAIGETLHYFRSLDRLFHVVSSHR
ncbi:MAG TPA: hypothetical protein VMS71_01585, partial [Candidatus Acidoferrum sp.]|nr:hypothetical protein [Candidatus Acidoferrum sp.]